MIKRAGAFFALAFLILVFSGCSMIYRPARDPRAEKEGAAESISAAEDSEEPNDQTVPDGAEETGQQNVFVTVHGIDIPYFSDSPYVTVNENIPFFTEEEKAQWSERALEAGNDREQILQYSGLDELGRCGPAAAVVSLDTLPEEDRGLIGAYLRPSGWHTVKYEGIDGNYLYNRCHLVAYCLCGDNADERNLITGTRYLNVVGMLPFEMEALGHVVKSRDHVIYRATPVFGENELLARGVLVEAWSMEDEGRSLSLCVFCYNVQPGIEIDYATGESEQIEVIPMESFSGSEIVVS